MIELPRRKFLTILTGVIAAPAVIKADSLMKVRSIVQPEYLLEAASEHWEYLTYQEVEIGQYQTGILYNVTRTETIPSMILDAYNKAMIDSFRQTKEIYSAKRIYK